MNVAFVHIHVYNCGCNFNRRTLLLQIGRCSTQSGPHPSYNIICYKTQQGKCQRDHVHKKTKTKHHHAATVESSTFNQQFVAFSPQFDIFTTPIEEGIGASDDATVGAVVVVVDNVVELLAPSFCFCMFSAFSLSLLPVSFSAFSFSALSFLLASNVSCNASTDLFECLRPQAFESFATNCDGSLEAMCCE